jgi:hypothetical protein
LGGGRRTNHVAGTGYHAFIDVNFIVIIKSFLPLVDTTDNAGGLGRPGFVGLTQEARKGNGRENSNDDDYYE